MCVGPEIAAMLAAAAPEAAAGTTAAAAGLGGGTAALFGPGAAGLSSLAAGSLGPATLGTMELGSGLLGTMPLAMTPAMTPLAMGPMAQMGTLPLGATPAMTPLSPMPGSGGIGGLFDKLTGNKPLMMGAGMLASANQPPPQQPVGAGPMPQRDSGPMQLHVPVSPQIGPTLGGATAMHARMQGMDPIALLRAKLMGRI